MEDIDKEIELAKLKLRILELEKELKENNTSVYIPYYPWYQDPHYWRDTSTPVQTDTITITL